MLARILAVLKSIGKGVWSFVSQSNVLGYTVSIGCAIAYVVIWSTVLGLVFDIIGTNLASLSVNVFGGFPNGAMWLLNQTFPVRLFFQLSVSLIVFRLTIAPLIMTAITATRKLKG